jgi:hypothetical protein
MGGRDAGTELAGRVKRRVEASRALARGAVEVAMRSTRDAWRTGQLATQAVEERYKCANAPCGGRSA